VPEPQPHGVAGYAFAESAVPKWQRAADGTATPDAEPPAAHHAAAWSAHALADALVGACGGLRRRRR